MVHAMQRGVDASPGTKDPITAVTAAPHMLLIGRSSGEVLCYTLPDLVPAGNGTFSVNASLCSINCYQNLASERKLLHSICACLPITCSQELL